MKMPSPKSAIASLVLILVLMLSACKSPAETVYSLGTSVNMADDAMIAAYEAKKIDRDQFACYVAASRAAHAAIGRLNDARLSGDTAKVDDLAKVAAAELAKAVLIRMNALGEK